jgi:hypothetical protein
VRVQTKGECQNNTSGANLLCAVIQWRRSYVQKITESVRIATQKKFLERIGAFEMDESLESKRKLDLECKKLEAEIRNLDQRWWKPAAIQAFPGLLLVLLSIFLAWATGVLDARRENLAAQNERLTIQKLKLEADEKAAMSELTTLQAKLADAQTQMTGLQTDRSAIAMIRGMNVRSSIDFDPQTGGYEVTLKKPTFTIVYEDSNGRNLDVDPLLKILNTLSQLKKLTKLSIESLDLGSRELAAIGVLGTIETLVTVNCDLNDQDMQEFPKLPNLKNIHMVQEKFSNPGVLGGYKGLEIISISSTPLSDAGLEMIYSLKTTVTSLSIPHTKVTDQSVSLINSCRQIRSLNIAWTAITAEGIDKIIPTERPFFLDLDPKQLTAESVAKLRKDKPDVYINQQNPY